MAEITYPYTLHCHKCRAKLKITSPKMLGKRLPCPKCGIKVDIVTPDEDGWVPYEVEEAPEIEREDDKELTDEELDAIEEKELKERKEKNWAMFKHVASIVILLGMLGGVGWGVYYYVIKDYDVNMTAREKAREENKDDLFGKTFKVD